MMSHRLTSADTCPVGFDGDFLALNPASCRGQVWMSRAKSDPKESIQFVPFPPVVWRFNLFGLSKKHFPREALASLFSPTATPPLTPA